MPFKDLMPSIFCDDPLDDPGIKGAMATVARGNCTFADKAKRVQHYGANALVIISSEGLVSGGSLCAAVVCGCGVRLWCT